MRRALPLVLLLAACATGAAERVWLKPGTPALAAERDFLACAADARRDFPPDRRIATAPRVTIGVGSCRGNLCVGGSRGLGGFGYGPDPYGPEIYDTDAAADLRARAVDACMAGKGYVGRSLPRCTATAAQLASQPFDTTGLCVANGRVAAPL